MKALFISIIMLTLSACTTHEAAVIGAIPGRLVGLPIGMAMTAVDETFKTAGDVVKANPRYHNTNNVSYSAPTKYTPHNQYKNHSYSANNNTHYYKAEILIKTQGKANFQSIQLLDNHDVTNFWQ